MAIYPDKKGGKLTGWFRVEVGVPGGGRLRARCRTQADAEKQEKDFKASRVAPKLEAAVEAPETLGGAIKRLSPQLWKGKKTGERMEHVASECVRLAGDITLANLESDPKITKDASGVVWVDRLIEELEDLEGWDGKLRGSSINRYLAPISKIFTTLRERREVLWTPKIKRQPEDNDRIRFFTAEEEAGLLNGTRATVSKFITCAILSGCRRSELFGIPLGTTKVEQRTPKGANLRITEGKTKASRRVIPVGPRFLEALDYLNEHGWPQVWDIYGDWQEVREAMGLIDDPDFVFHVCRHTCATRLLQSNVPGGIATVRKWLGHTNIKTTLRYAHVVADMLGEGTALLEGWGSGENPTTEITAPVPNTPNKVAA